MAQSNLEAIRIKVRRITRSPSESQISDDQINEYINTFVLYDFPEHLRLFNLKTTLTFFTQAYIDTYDTNTMDVTDPLYDFKNKYLTIQPPIYIAGYQALFSQSRTQFFGIYPLLNSIASIGTTGDGTTTQFSGTINTQQANMQPYVQNSTQGTIILRDNVTFSSIDSSSDTLTLVDYPVSPSSGALGLPGQPQALPSPYGNINYLTGAFTINFPTAPGVGMPINSETVPLQPTLPQALLYYDGMFTLRPVPDQAYRVNMEVFVRPTELLSDGQNPELNEWWQYIAYGAAKKIFEDRMDYESLNLMMPSFKEQEMLINRRTIVQQTSQRTSTIYSEQISPSGTYGSGWFSGGGQF